MENNSVEFQIKIIGDALEKIKQMTGATNDLGDSATKAQSKIAELGKVAVGLNQAWEIAKKLNAVSKEYVEANRAQQEAEVKLGQVMRNTMGATAEEIQSIKDLASAQQKLGAIGDEVQLAGAQELGTYLEKTDSLKKLMPVMNDMLAQQYGLNASQDQAVQIGSMMGKVMDGQVGALSRYGYKFDEAQEKLLKYGTEEQKVATLAEVISQSVGGMNETLASTPEGKMKQLENAMGDIKERIGNIRVKLATKFIPVMEWGVGALNKIISGCIRFRVPLAILLGLLGTFGALMATVAIKAKLLALWQGICSTATAAWNVVQTIFNATLWACPITWIVMGIVALIAAIYVCCTKITGWGSLWKGVVGFMKNTFMGFVDIVKLKWTTLINGIMMGLDNIKLGWYEFKNAVGLGDKAENQRAIYRIQDDIEKRKKAIADGAKKVKQDFVAAGESLGSIEMGWKKSDKASDKVKSSTVGSQLLAMVGVTSPGKTSSGSGTSKGKGTEDMATGGSRSTSVTINLKSLVEKMVFEGGLGESRSEMERQVSEALLQVLNMAQASVS